MPLIYKYKVRLDNDTVVIYALILNEMANMTHENDKFIKTFYKWEISDKPSN